MPQGNLVEVLGREVRKGSPGELMVESSPSRQRRPPCKTSKEMSDEAADAAGLTYLPYLLTYLLMAGQEHIEQGDSGSLPLEDLCGGPVDVDLMRHVPEPEFTASVRNLHHQLESQHQLLSNMKADFDQKWDHRERAMHEQMEAQRRDLERFLGEEHPRTHVINHSSSFAGLCGGSPSGPSGLESTKSTTCPTLGSDGKGEMVTVAEYKAWAFCARAWYDTNSIMVPKKNSELLASIRGKPAQVIAACVPIELALGSDGVQKIG